MTIEVSDLYDAFHLIAQTIWSTGEFEYMTADSRDWEQNRRNRKINSIGATFDQLMDSLEYDFFFTSCARRIFKQTGLEISLDEIITRLRLHDTNGIVLEGEIQEYHSHGFDWPQDNVEENEIGNAAIGGKLWPPHNRSEVRLFIHISGS